MNAAICLRLKAAVIFVGQPRGGFKLSFSKPMSFGLVMSIARQFGAGGHKAAAGAFPEGTLEEVQGAGPSR